MTELEPGESLGKTRSGLPVSLLVGTITGALLIASAMLRVRDVDLFWHLLAGAELRSGVPADTLGTGWSYAPDPVPWVTTQWLTEVALNAIHELLGWAGLVAYRTLTAAVAVAVLAYFTLRGRPAILAGFPFLIAATATIAVSQERSNQISLIGAAVLGGVLVAGLAGGRLPRWWLLVPATWIWANFHGGWILVPLTLIVIAVGRALDHGLKDGAVPKALLLSIASAVAGTLTPAGTAGTFALLRFSGATDAIQEWQPTQPMSGLGYLTAAMAVLVIVGVARKPTPWSTIVVSVILLVYSWAAVRNVAPALLLLAPMVASLLVSTFPGVGSAPEPRWSRPAGVISAGLLTVLGLAALPGRELLPHGTFPIELASAIAELPVAPGQRVLNDYNVAGMVLFFGGPDTQVGIDGRTDRYGQQYIEDYTGMMNLNGEWEAMLDKLDPTSALLKEDAALTHVLVHERGWTNVGSEGDWVLLIPST